MKNIESTKDLHIQYNDDGLIPVITQENSTKHVLMMAYMNSDALNRSLTEGIMYYYSRSRQELWLKGKTSGQIQHINHLYTDCDQDCLLALVTVAGNGGCCHVGYPNCFYREIDMKTSQLKINLEKLSP